MRKISHSENLESATRNHTETPVRKNSVQSLGDGDFLDYCCMPNHPGMGQNFKFLCKRFFHPESGWTSTDVGCAFVSVWGAGYNSTEFSWRYWLGFPLLFHQPFEEDRGNKLRQDCWTPSCDAVPYCSEIKHQSRLQRVLAESPISRFRTSRHNTQFEDLGFWGT